MAKKYVLKLMAEERVELEQLVKRGKAAAWKVQRAQALLQCDQGQGGPAWADEQVAQAYGCTTRSVESWRKQAVERGPLSLLERKPRTTPIHKLDGEKEAFGAVSLFARRQKATRVGHCDCCRSG